MKEVLIYMLKANGCFVILYLLYYAVFHRYTFFFINRLYLLAIAFVSLLLPALRFPFFQEISELMAWLPEFIFYAGNSAAGEAESQDRWSTFALVYLLGVVFFLARYLISLFRLTALIRTAEKEHKKDYVLICPDRECPTFSFFTYLHLHADDTDHREVIEAHERVHIRQFHSADNLFYELFKSFCWFNPFAYHAHRSLRNVHEFLADREAAGNSLSRSDYSRLLLHKVMNMPGIPLTHSFFQLSNLKNRINMMNKQPSHSTYRANYFLFFPVLIFLFAANSRINSTRANGLEAFSWSRFSTSDTVHSKVDQMPVFGDENQLVEYLGKQITYPGKAKKEKKEGTVFVEFVIDQKGAVTQVRVSKGVSAELDEEALRVVREMPSWTPGRHQGKAVQVKQVLPIRFALAKE